MTQLLFFFWSSFLIGLSGAMMPGPVLTATVSEATRRGFWAGPLIILGHGLVEIVLLAAILAGLGAWLAGNQVQAVLGMVGGVALLMMGMVTSVTARRAAHEAMEDQRIVAGSPLHGPVVAGIVTTCSNPYWYLWWSTVGLTYASHSLTAGVAGLTSFFAGHILSDLGWYSLVAGGMATGRRFMRESAYRGVLVGCGAALIGLGVWFFSSGWGGLR